jgi:glutamyl-tRNA synthetase
MILTLY